MLKDVSPHSFLCRKLSIHWDIGDFPPPGASMSLLFRTKPSKQSHISLNSLGKSLIKIAVACSLSA